MEINFDIKKSTSFKIGGQIARMYFPTSVEEFVDIKTKEPDAFVAGNLSNILVSSDGYDGAVICTKKMDSIKFDGNTVFAGAGVRGTKLSKLALEKGLSGLEFMVAFPGSVGGEVFMNAGAHGQMIADVLKSAKVYCPEKGVIKLANADMEFSYRTSVCQKMPYSVLEAEFELTPSTTDKIQEKMNENLSFRQNKQPSLTLPNCGSTFRNPDGDSAGRLLDAAGVKGLVSGGVHVWENHANFIINDGEGTSLDVLRLMDEMYSRVKEKFDIELKPEVRYLGGNNKEEVEICRKLKML
ncbi:uDP-N-acetylenolpyruvoylglucosamine reductase [Fusobacterium sp. CAG:439]|nr:uDP-N-acetylenolpyruvoylglucosamine reductase [Fusobacterium sp. CAG:439]